MQLSKRNLFKAATLAAGTAALTPLARARRQTAKAPALPNLSKRAVPISVAERQARITRAQKVMAKQGLDVLLLEPGSAMRYFTGISWWRSERLTAVIIPRRGDIAIVTPFFEEPSVRESMTFGDDVRTWNEHENPFVRIAGVLKDRGLKRGRIGVEATVRYFVVEGLQQAAPNFTVVGASGVTRACRMFKSPAEIALMKIASDITLRAYAHVHSQLDKGMTSDDINALMRQAQASLGGDSIWTMALLGESSAYPHGSHKPQTVEEGQIILLDCGCAVEGYQSDISRTFVYGEPSKQQRRIWKLVRKGQLTALATAQPGRPAGSVDDAVRKLYEAEGFGPGYRLPGLSHRTGHGIGMDGHEPVNIVKGESTPLAAGMCFSNEPGIYLPGQFGVRLEDCIHMTDSGPAWFTVPPESLEKPIGRLG